MVKQYDLEERTSTFAACVRDFMRRLPKDLTNMEFSRQLIRSSSSVGADYIEANEALSRKDSLVRIKVSRKEPKESRYWLRLMVPQKSQMRDREQLVQESTELLMIFTAILKKTEGARPREA
jgi:four helix bundle protein